jgi:hypothetical protein
MKSDHLRYIRNGGLYQINVIVIFWQGFTACLAANDHFLSNSLLGQQLSTYACDNLYLPTDLPPLYAMSHIFHISYYDVLKGGISCFAWDVPHDATQNAATADTSEAKGL